MVSELDKTAAGGSIEPKREQTHTCAACKIMKKTINVKIATVQFVKNVVKNSPRRDGYTPTSQRGRRTTASIAQRFYGCTRTRGVVFFRTCMLSRPAAARRLVKIGQCMLGTSGFLPLDCDGRSWASYTVRHPFQIRRLAPNSTVYRESTSVEPTDNATKGTFQTLLDSPHCALAGLRSSIQY
jgi:hypothetical protein